MSLAHSHLIQLFINLMDVTADVDKEKEKKIVSVKDFSVVCRLANRTALVCS